MPYRIVKYMSTERKIILITELTVIGWIDMARSIWLGIVPLGVFL
jgi:hypothetical protein